MKYYGLIAGLFFAVLFASCSSSKTVLPYFVDIAGVKEGTLPLNDYLPKICPDDELYINVSSINQSATAAYNLPMANPATRQQFSSSSAPRQKTYIVSKAGDIDFPVLGTVHVAGMNVEELEAYLESRISADVEDPTVDVQLVNFRVSVAGEVKTPGPIEVTRNRMTILEALTAAGDLTEFGERSNVLVIREVDGERKYAHIDLNSSEMLNSPYYYVQPNDYIYVQPNNIRQANSKYNQNNAYKLSVISTVVSAVSVVASLMIALVL